MKKADLDQLTFFVLRGKNKREIFSIIKNDYPITQAQIYQKTKMYRTHIGRTVRTLEEKKIVKCVNPEEKTYKIYKPTNLGKKVAENIDNYTKRKPQ